MITILEMQYGYLKRSRKVLLDYCSTMSCEHLIAEKQIFGRGSIRNLLVHTANSYFYWIGLQALKQQVEFTPNASINTIEEVQGLYKEVDDLMSSFFEFVKATPTAKFVIKVKGEEKGFDALELFTHMLTHEFHHKGQVLTFSRALGYQPVDTDVL